MLIHAMLALGAETAGRDADGRVFAQLSRQALLASPDWQRCQVVQARLLLTLYYHASGQAKEAWALAVWGLPAAFAASQVSERNQDTEGVG